MLKKLSIKQKMIYWNIFIIILFIIVLIYLENLSIERLMSEKETQIKNLGDAASGIIYKYMKLENEGKLTHDQAVEQIKDIINSARYDKDNYFFIGDTDMRQITNPKKLSENGKVQNTSAYKLFQETAFKNHDSAYLKYFSTRPGTTKEFPKITYLKMIPEWKWFIGTGIYIDDIENQKFKNYILNFVLCLLFTFLLMLGGIILVNLISVPLSNLVKLLKLSSTNIEEKSEHLKNMCDDISKSSKSQANSIQDTTAAIAEVTSMISKTSNLTIQSANLSNTISLQTEIGNNAVKEMVLSMQSIQEASKKLSEIEEIITQIENKAMVINDIVAKTELLSLNASIESARAGEHGKGFAVVAEEVGYLAKSSGKSSSEIRNLLDKSRENVKKILELTIARVSEGQNKTHEVSNVFSQIVTNIHNIHAQMTQITEATKEQELGIKQISSAMVKIDTSASKNLENSEKSIEGTEQLLKISQDLKSITLQTENIVFGVKFN